MNYKVTSYPCILKSSSIIGGASVINILIELVRTKTVVVLLGPAGIGLVSPYTGLMSTATAVGTLIHYPIPPHLQQAYASGGYVQGQFPIAEKIANQCLSLPIGPHLGHEQVADVIAATTKTVVTM